MLIIVSIGIFLVSASADNTEQRRVDAIKKSLREKNEGEAGKRAAEFIKSFPGSGRVPDVRLIQADLEPSPAEALKLYRHIADRYRSFERRDRAIYRACEIDYIMSKWNDLKAESAEGMALQKNGRYDFDFHLFHVIALMELGEYETAGAECAALIESNHDYNQLARALLVQACLFKKTTGQSKQYIGSIREIAVGFSDSDVMQTALYLLGEYFAHRKMYDESYSAFMDLVSRYPGSPESIEAEKQCRSLARYKPRRVFYLPGKKIVEDAESIDISPDIDIPDEREGTVFYSISLGPFETLKRAREIKKLLGEYDFIKTVKLKNGYALYVARCPGEDSVLRVKIRLAEEFGLNGRIVRVTGDGKNSFIYGE